MGITTVTNPYDGLGRKIQVDDPDSGTCKYGYDPAGNLIFEQDPKAGRQHIQACFDELNRILVRVVYDAGSEDYRPFRPRRGGAIGRPRRPGAAP